VDVERQRTTPCDLANMVAPVDRLDPVDRSPHLAQFPW
jgi:hypothetical protein